MNGAIIKALPLFLISLLPAPLAAQSTEAVFAVRALGVGVGEIRLSGVATAKRYAASSRFAATGLAGALARIRVEQSVTGARQGSRWLPSHYGEEINTSRRRSSAQLRYAGGIPQLTGGKLGTEGAPKLDPARQGGTVDPLTGLFAVLRDRAASGLCQIDLTQFDGARRTRLRLTRTEPRPGGITRCHGIFERLDGYSAQELARQKRFRFHIDFRSTDAGLMQAQRAETQSTRGAVTLIRK